MAEKKQSVVKVIGSVMAVAVAVLAGNYGITFIPTPQTRARDVAQNLTAETAVRTEDTFYQLTEFERNFRKHIEDQKYDRDNQAALDRDQDARLQMQMEGINFMQNGQAVLVERTRNIEVTMGEMRADIKKLLERRP